MKTKSIEFRVTAVVTVDVPEDWSDEYCDEVFRSRINTHLELDDSLSPVESAMSLNDAELVRIANA